MVDGAHIPINFPGCQGRGYIRYKLGGQLQFNHFAEVAFIPRNFPGCRGVIGLKSLKSSTFQPHLSKLWPCSVQPSLIRTNTGQTLSSYDASRRSTPGGELFPARYYWHGLLKIVWGGTTTHGLINRLLIAAGARSSTAT